MTKSLRRVPTRMEADEALRSRWLPTWEQATGRSFATACEEVTAECCDLVASAGRIRRGGTLEERYGELAAAVGGLNPKTRGSGTISALLALWIAWAADGDPVPALRVVANLRGSDTDTVATLAGALLGAVVDEDPPGALLDRELITTEAQRLDDIRNGLTTDDFPHPDPLGWAPPQTQSDSLGVGRNGELMVLGLGRCEPLGDELVGSGKNPGRWQWVRSEFGQTLCIKRRAGLATVPDGSLPRARNPSKPSRLLADDALDDPSGSELKGRPNDPGPQRRERPEVEDPGLPADIESALTAAAEAAFDEHVIGRLLLHLARQQHGAEKAGIFAGLLARVLPEP